jgi:UDP-3-O-[3-hydroxymyristoyl] glucosamine N-acyltransferase
MIRNAFYIFEAAQIAGILNGEVQGDPEVTVSGLSKIEEGQPNTLSFLANTKYEEFIYSTGASIVIVNKDFKPTNDLPKSLTLVKVDDAYSCFAKLLDVYNQMRQKQPQIEQPCFVSPSAQIGNEVYVGAFAYISEDAIIAKGAKIYPNAYIGEGVSIGENTTIFPGVKIYRDCKVGANCIIHAGSVIGADGFGFAPDAEGNFQKVPQIGNVVIEDNVEIGANCTIDRATLGSTFIRQGAKIDNLVQIAHNVDVGKNSAMAAQVGVAGSTKIGERVMVGGQAGISGHIKIADDTKIVAQSGIPGSVKKSGQILMGSPGIPMEDFKKSYFGFRKLPYILEKLRELEDRIKD